MSAINPPVILTIQTLVRTNLFMTFHASINDKKIHDDTTNFIDNHVYQRKRLLGNI